MAAGICARMADTSPCRSGVITRKLQTDIKKTDCSQTTTRKQISGGRKRQSWGHCGMCIQSHVAISIRRTFKCANAGDIGSRRAEGDEYNLDVVVKSSQGSEHMVHTNGWRLRGKNSNSRQGQDVKKALKSVL